MTRKEGGKDEEKFIRNLHKGDFFGEKALSGEEVRTANIIADDSSGVVCLVIDRYEILAKRNKKIYRYSYEMI